MSFTRRGRASFRDRLVPTRAASSGFGRHLGLVRFGSFCLPPSASRLSVSTWEAAGNPVTPALQGGTLGKSTVENVADLVESGLCTAWREATEPADKSCPKR